MGDPKNPLPQLLCQIQKILIVSTICYLDYLWNISFLYNILGLLFYLVYIWIFGMLLLDFCWWITSFVISWLFQKDEISGRL